MSRDVLSWVCAAVGAWAAWQSFTDDVGAALALPLQPVRGERLDAAVATPEADPDAAEQAPPLVDGLPLVDFGRLLFKDYDAPELRDPPGVPLTAADFPEGARRWDDQEIVIEGYALAAELVDGRIQSVILSRFPPGCCFGTMPVLDEWMDVTLVDGGTEPFPSTVPVKVAGRLTMGEVLDEGGVVASLYRMSGARRVD